MKKVRIPVMETACYYENPIAHAIGDASSPQLPERKRRDELSQLHFRFIRDAGGYLDG